MYTTPSPAATGDQPEMEAPRPRPKHPIDKMQTARHRTNKARLPVALLSRGGLVAEVGLEVGGPSADRCDKLEEKDPVINSWYRIVTLAP